MPSGPGPIDDNCIREIANTVPPGVGSVLLSSETSADGLIAHVVRCAPAVLQIVDAPDPGARAALRRAFPALRLMQVIHVEGADALDQARAAAAEVDAILLDSGRPSAAIRELGGTGRVHDWSVSARIVQGVPVPVFLAGGLNPGNVAEAIRAVRPFGVDVCSGLRRGGVLDAGLVAAFMKAAASA